MGVVVGNAGLSGGWVGDGSGWSSTTPIREVTPARGGCGVAPPCAVERPPLRVWSSCVKQLPLGAGGRSPSSRVPVSFRSISAVGRGSAHRRGLPRSRSRSSFKLACQRLCRCGHARLSVFKDRLPEGLLSPTPTACLARHLTARRSCLTDILRRAVQYATTLTCGAAANSLSTPVTRTRGFPKKKNRKKKWRPGDTQHTQQRLTTEQHATWTDKAQEAIKD